MAGLVASPHILSILNACALEHTKWTVWTALAHFISELFTFIINYLMRFCYLLLTVMILRLITSNIFFSILKRQIGKQQLLASFFLDISRLLRFFFFLFHSFIKRCQTCNCNQKCWYYTSTQTHIHAGVWASWWVCVIVVPFEWFFHRSCTLVITGW